MEVFSSMQATFRAVRTKYMHKPMKWTLFWFSYGSPIVLFWSSQENMTATWHKKRSDLFLLVFNFAIKRAGTVFGGKLARAEQQREAFCQA